MNRFTWLCLLLLVFSESNAQSVFTYESDSLPTLDMMMDAREVFEFEVSYGFLTLGWIDVELLPDTTVDGETAYHLRTRIRSNNRLIFVGTRIVNYESIFQYNDQWPYAHVFWRDDIHDDDYDRVRVVFDREEGLVHFYEYGEFELSLELEEPASGGDVIFFYSRMFAGIDDPYVLPVYTENEKGYVRARSSDDIEYRSYDAFDEKIPTYMSEGTADVEGPFGFRGNFKSWFSTDDLRIPVEAHVKIIFGNVKVRLISYERNGEY
ncbi:MAG: DUF3108 domain-containing protein [Balneolaceae bacterium]